MGTYIIIGAVVLVLLAALLAAIRARNRFVTLRNRVENQKSQIDVQLKRRYSLIPNLLETAKGYAGFERATLEAVAKARASAMEARGFESVMDANKRLSAAVRQLLAVGEAYPELKANRNFMQLQNELAETENKIAYSRQFYTDTLYKYNNAIELFPASLVAKACGFQPMAPWEAGEAERADITFKAEDFRF